MKIMLFYWSIFGHMVSRRQWQTMVQRSNNILNIYCKMHRKQNKILYKYENDMFEVLRSIHFRYFTYWKVHGTVNNIRKNMSNGFFKLYCHFHPLYHATYTALSTTKIMWKCDCSFEGRFQFKKQQYSLCGIFNKPCHTMNVLFYINLHRYDCFLLNIWPQP